MKKGQVVTCLSSTVGNFTVGESYAVVAGNGDKDVIFGDKVEGEGMMLSDDDGDLVYAVFPECEYGSWSLCNEQ